MPKALDHEHKSLILDDEDLTAIAGLDRSDGRLGPDPDAMNFAGQVGD